jgi:hypothetical protein
MHSSKWPAWPMLILSFFVLEFGFLAHAYTPSEGKVVAMAGPMLYRTHADPVPAAADSPWASGIALVAEGDVDKNGGLELGMFYLNKEYFREDGGVLEIERAKRMYVTMGYRHWFTERISVAGAFSTGYTMGDAKVIHADAPNGRRPDTTAGETSEYGFDFSAQWEVWSQDKFAIVADLRYYAAITQKDHEDANHYGGLLGFRYQIQEK